MFVNVVLFAFLTFFALIGLGFLIYIVANGIYEDYKLLIENKEKELNKKISKSVKEEISKFYCTRKRSK